MSDLKQKKRDNSEIAELSSSPMRLARRMSLAGVASRRKSEELIFMGEVKVNGTTVTTPGTTVSPDDEVTVSGKRLTVVSKVHIMLNKPTGYLCSASDPHADQTVFDLVKLHGVRLFSAGRLDLNSEGLLILTNDGDYVEKLTHPRHGVLKRYQVRTDKAMSKEKLDMLRAGIRDFGEFLKPISITRVKPKEYEFTLNEGKKREIRRLVAATGSKVTLLKRISIGNLLLGPLPTGHWRYISKKEIDASLVSARFARKLGKARRNAPSKKSKEK